MYEISCTSIKYLGIIVKQCDMLHLHVTLRIAGHLLSLRAQFLQKMCEI